MSWFEKLKLRIQILTVIMAGFCPVLLIWMASDIKRQVASYRWPAVQGTVESLNVKPWKDNNGVMKFFGRVAYRYDVDGKPYATDLTDLGPDAKRDDERTAAADVGEYHMGDTVRVFYDPADPSVAVLKKGIPQIHLILLAVLSVGSIVAVPGSIFVVRSWLRAWRARKPA